MTVMRKHFAGHKKRITHIAKIVAFKHSTNFYKNIQSCLLCYVRFYFTYNQERVHSNPAMLPARRTRVRLQPERTRRSVALGRRVRDGPTTVTRRFDGACLATF